ncbi:MAG: ATP-binding cassette domain-containing protein [Deltaproteobacteria bacterium]|nr:ATP-binding cassette domain-containing protein [Deltaproteobacteria bacterium]MBI3388940.1 ATP-binding cassette domain-containing protein [Deltaproteobacteria bacterium]
MTKEALIEAENVVVEFGEHRVLHGLTLTIHAGEVVCLIGGSGSGKTTSLRAMLGLVTPTRGTIRVLGVDLMHADEAERTKVARQMGMLFQHSALLGGLTTEENVALPLTQRGDLTPDMIRSLARTRLAQVGLGDAVTNYPRELSGGMQKRAALARAVVHEPRLVFCDEPSSGLDPATVVAIDELMVRLRDDIGAALVVVTHHPASVKRIADRVVLLRNGTVAADGSVAAVRALGDPWIDGFFSEDVAPPSHGLNMAEALGLVAARGAAA